MSWLLDSLWELLEHLWQHLWDNPVQTAIVVVVIARTFGTTIQTGWKGVLFSFGRVRKELEPGFHPLIPFVQRVRKIPTRSITMHLPMQRITTADGLVYDVQVNLVYRIVDPSKAMVQIDNIRQGCETVLPVIIQDLLGAQSRGQLQERKALDAELTVRAEAKLQRWGATVEQAGFMNIAPTSKTLRLTQLGLLARERERMWRRYRDAGLSPDLAVALLGADRKASAHSTARYRARSRQVAALKKAFLKAFLAEERQRVAAHYTQFGQPQEVAVALAAADLGLLERASARAHLASRQSAARRRHPVAPVTPAPTAIE
jgi:regulator of protease activity HflC (stomatin/prohibitin superfamily)